MRRKNRRRKLLLHYISFPLHLMRLSYLHSLHLPKISDIFKTCSAGWQIPCRFLWRKSRISSIKLLDILHTSSSSFKISLPISEALLNPAKVLWQTPASIPMTCKCTNKKYCIPAKDAEFLFSHPTPNSLVVSTVQERGHHYQSCASHPDRVWKCLVLFGHKAYPSAMLQF